MYCAVGYELFGYSRTEILRRILGYEVRVSIVCQASCNGLLRCERIQATYLSSLVS